MVSLFAPATAGAQPSSDPTSRRNELSSVIEGASAAEVGAVKELEAATAHRQELEAKVMALDHQVSDAAQKVRAAEADIARLTAEIGTVQSEIERILAEIEKQNARFNESILALYKRSGNGGGSALSLLSKTAGAHDLVAGSRYAEESSRRLDRELQRQGALKDQLANARSALEEQQAQARGAERAASEERERVTQLRATADAEREQAIAAEAQEQRLIEGIRARKAEFEAEYRAVQAQIEAQIAAVVSRANPAIPPPRPGPAQAPGPKAGSGPASPSRNARFILPVNGAITSGFGPRIHPISGGSRMHTGLDIGASSGTPIKAADAGTVVMAGWNGGYGNWTLVDHGGGLATGYGHQSSIGVSVGQRVGRGQVIGRVGSTGASTGPHLHWEVRVNGNPVNPIGWF